MAKTTYPDIARLAGVGTATVERVLNERGGVRPETVEKVIAAARALDYPKRLPEAHRGLLRIEVILVRPETTFFARLSQAYERIAATLDSSVAVYRSFLDEHDPATIAQRIAAPTMRRAGLILAVPDHGLVRTAIAKVTESGLPVIQIVTRAGDTDTDFVGIDNYAAGRSAAMFLSRMQAGQGSVIAFCHSQIYQVHRDRIRGFSDYFAENPRAGLRYVCTLFGHDQARRSADLLRMALKIWPDLVGLYNAGGANASLFSILKDHPRKPRVFFIGHELTERSADALREGVMSVVLDQMPETQARRSMDLMLSKLGLLNQEVANPPIRFVTITAENI